MFGFRLTIYPEALIFNPQLALVSHARKTPAHIETGGLKFTQPEGLGGFFVVPGLVLGCLTK